MAFKDLIGTVVSKEVTFMNTKVKIRKLNYAQVEEIQAAAKAIEGDESNAMDMLRLVISMSVEGAEELSVDDFRKFPIEDLNKLSEEILRYSGLGKALEKAST